jgi:hypothetical protein
VSNPPPYFIEAMVIGVVRGIKRSISTLNESSSCAFPKSSVKSDYLLLSKVKLVPLEESGLGLDFDKNPKREVGWKSFLSKAQLQAKKDIKNGKQVTIV